MHQATMQHVTSEAVSPTIHQPQAQTALDLLCWSFQVLPVCRPLQLLSWGADLLNCKCCTGSVKCPFADPFKGRKECVHRHICPQTNLSTGSASHSLKNASCNKPAPKVVRAKWVTEHNQVWPSEPSTCLISAVVGVGYGKSTQIKLRRGQPLLEQEWKKTQISASRGKIP